MALSPSQAIASLNSFARTFGPLLDLVPKLEEIGKLEDYQAELQSSVASSKAALEKLQGDLAAAEDEAAKAKAIASSVIVVANKQAADITDKAKADAEATRAEARNTLSSEITNLSFVKEKLGKEISGLTEKSDLLAKKISDQESMLEKLNNAIAEIKAKL